MNDKHPLRRVYDVIEKEVTPLVESVVHSDEFATTTSLIANVRRRVGRGIDGVNARLWHLVNLPAGTDVKRLRQQLGSLDREVRQLTLLLERMQHERSEGGVKGVDTGKAKRGARSGSQGDRP